MNSENQYLSLKEVATLLHKNERTIRRYCYLKIIPHSKIGKTVLFMRDEIDEWVRIQKRIEIDSR